MHALLAHTHYYSIYLIRIRMPAALVTVVSPGPILEITVEPAVPDSQVRLFFEEMGPDGYMSTSSIIFYDQDSDDGIGLFGLINGFDSSVYFLRGDVTYSLYLIDMPSGDDLEFVTPEITEPVTQVPVTVSGAPLYNCSSMYYIEETTSRPPRPARDR